MSVHAQVDGVGTLEFPDGTDPAVIQATVKKVIAGKSGGGATPPAAAAPPAPTPHATHSLAADADIAASVVSGSVASLAGGVVKAGAAANKALGILDGDKFDFEHGTDKLESMLTWKPKTESGKLVMADIATGLHKFEEWTGKVGEESAATILKAGDKAGELAKSMGAPQAVVDFIDRHKEQVAAAYGAATKTGLNAVPLVLGGELTKLPGAKPKPLAEAPPVAGAAPAAADLSLAPSPPRAAPGASASPVPPVAAPLEVAPQVPRGTPSSVGEGPLPPRPTPTSPRARAEAYARDRLGLSWDALGEATRRKLETVASDAQGLDRLNPEAVKRQAHLESLPVPIKTTAGRLNRDNTQLLKEEGAVATRAGKPIEDIDIQANRGIRANVDYLIDKLKGVGQSRATATDREGVGRAVAGRGEDAPGALTLKQAKAKAKTRAAYAEARKTEPNAEASAAPLFDYFKDNPSVQHVGWMSDWLNKAKVAMPEGVETPNRGVKLNELDDLRKRALAIGPTHPDFHYANEVVGTIDKIFDTIPESAPKWKAAREAHSAERGEFKNQEAIDRLVATKGGRFGTDPKTALEDVWKVSVKTAKLEQIRTLKRSLLSGDDPAVRLQGKKALRELRAETARNMLTEITKGVSTNAKGEANITAESINNWIKGMGDGTVEGGVEKLNVILGRRNTRKLLDIREAAQITKTAPTTRTSGSNTFSRILNWIEDTGFGDTVKGVAGTPIKLAEMAWKAGEGGRVATAAAKDATSAGAKAGAKAAAKRADQIQREQTGGRIPTYGQP